jgi:uncharacterized membrane protein
LCRAEPAFGEVRCSVIRNHSVKRKGAQATEALHTFIELGARAIEGLAVALIVGTFLWSSVRFLVHTGRHAPTPYQRYKLFLGRALTLGLEFLVAADVIRTVGVAPTFRNIGILGAIIVIRTVLSWSIAVEMEGRWPWQPATRQDSELKA